MKKVLLVIFSMIVFIFSFYVANLFLGESVSIKVSTPTLTKLNDYVVCTGKLEEKQKKDFFAEGTGFLKKLNFNVGDGVKEGEVLAVFTKTATVNTQSSTEAIKNYTNGLDISSILPGITLPTNKTPESVENEEPTEIEIIAPFDGIITEINASEGKAINTAKPILTLSDLSTLQIKTNINEASITKISIGQKAFISGEGFKNTQCVGTVESISPIAKQVISTTFSETAVEAVIKIDNKYNLRPGFSANIKILVSEKNDALVVPYDAILQDENQKEFVYKIQKGKAVKQEIVSGSENEDGIEILTGLNKNDVIITTPNEKINSKIKLKPLKGSEN